MDYSGNTYGRDYYDRSRGASDTSHFVQDDYYDSGDEDIRSPSTFRPPPRTSSLPVTRSHAGYQQTPAPSLGGYGSQYPPSSYDGYPPTSVPPSIYGTGGYDVGGDFPPPPPWYTGPEHEPFSTNLPSHGGIRVQREVIVSDSTERAPAGYTLATSNTVVGGSGREVRDSEREQVWQGPENDWNAPPEESAGGSRSGKNKDGTTKKVVRKLKSSKSLQNLKRRLPGSGRR